MGCSHRSQFPSLLQSQNSPGCSTNCGGSSNNDHYAPTAAPTAAAKGGGRGRRPKAAAEEGDQESGPNQDSKEGSVSNQDSEEEEEEGQRRQRRHAPRRPRTLPCSCRPSTPSTRRRTWRRCRCRPLPGTSRSSGPRWSAPPVPAAVGETVISLTLSLSVLKHLLKGEGSAAERQSRQRLPRLHPRVAAVERGGVV